MDVDHDASMADATLWDDFDSLIDVLEGKGEGKGEGRGDDVPEGSKGKGKGDDALDGSKGKGKGVDALDGGKGKGGHNASKGKGKCKDEDAVVWGPAMWQPVGPAPNIGESMEHWRKRGRPLTLSGECK